MDRKISLFGADDCDDTQRLRAHLDELHLRYSYVNVEENSFAEHRLRAWNAGRRRTPAIVMTGRLGTERLLAPDVEQLDHSLVRQGLL